MPEASNRVDRQAVALQKLHADGFVENRAGTTRTTRSWQGAMARTALALLQRGEAWQDLRLPISAVLIAAHPEADLDELADLVEAMLPIEQLELSGGRVAAAVQAPGDQEEHPPAGPNRRT